VLPESAPFTVEQRAYLNGFLAGLFSRAPAPNVPGAASAPPPLAPLTVLFGSQTGNAEKLAKRIAKEAGKRGFAASVHDLAHYAPAGLSAERQVLLVTSTYGDGDPPDNARGFWNLVAGENAPRLDGLRFSLCSLGDQNYPRFCAFGRALDARLEALGARRVHPRQDCDVDFEQPFLAWVNGALKALGGEAGAAVPSAANADSNAAAAIAGDEAFSRKRPYVARLLSNRRLSAAGSSKEVRHFVVSLGESGLRYEAGDALGVWPRNDPALVEELLGALGLDGAEPVVARAGATAPLREALNGHYEITRIPRLMLDHFAAVTGDATLVAAVSPNANGKLQQFLLGREVIDLVLAYPAVRFTPEAFAALLRPMQPRLYSIASSPSVYPHEAHLCVSVVRYTSLGRARGGVTSTFLADRAAGDTAVPVFVQANAAFRLPPPDAPLIMIGPGTGIAPFRAFLQQRRAAGAAGRNWLFFGDQHAATDFLYREEIEAFQREGLLTRLDLAWSRDQAQKVYVQDRMRSAAKELFGWIEAGGCVCVCGDARRMAKDVDAGLHEIVREAGGRTSEQAAEYIRRLAAERRYVRDVY
jgi:sulfite reductase (NADPH) flavoprotein alpha-component